MIQLFFFFYRFLVVPFALMLLLLVTPFNRKLKQSFALRRSIKWPSFKIAPVWIHASSGEFEYAKPVIRELKRRNPDRPIVVTYSSPSFANNIQNFAGVDFSAPLPLDTPSATRSFIKHIRPSAFMVARTDLWPELLYAIHEMRVPSLLFSATFRPLKGVRAIARPYYQMLFNFFTEIYAVSDTDKNNILQSQTTAPVATKGDTRYDQVLYRLQNQQPVKDALLQNLPMPLLICGSTWPEDEEKIWPAAQKLLKAKKLKLVVAPHEPTPEHLKAIEEQVKSHGLTSVRYSATEANFTSDILIIDKVGILAELYTRGQIAFVGGSFRSKVHSVMEPLAAGLPTLVGPFHTNNREAIQFQTVKLSHSHTNENGQGATATMTAVKAVRDTEDFATTLEQRIEQIQHASVLTALQAKIIEQAGRSHKVCDWLTNATNGGST